MGKKKRKRIEKQQVEIPQKKHFKIEDLNKELTNKILYKITLFLIFALLLLFSFRDVSSLDTGFHLKAGNYILSGQGFPKNDPFTYTINDHPYTDTSWGYQVLISIFQKIAGSK